MKKEKDMTPKQYRGFFFPSSSLLLCFIHLHPSPLPPSSLYGGKKKEEKEKKGKGEKTLRFLDIEMSDT